MRTLSVISFLFLGALTLHSQQDVSSVAVPNLEISDISLADLNGNMIIEAGESCKLTFTINNTGYRSANSLKIKLSHTASEPIDIKYRKSKSLLVVSARSSREVSFPIDAGSNVPEGEIEFIINVLEVDGFDAYPAKIQFATAPGNIEPSSAQEIIESTEISESETVETGVKDTSSLVIQNLQVFDPNQNETLEAYETVYIKFRLYNLEDEDVQNIHVYVKQTDEQVTGIKYNKSLDLGNYPSYYMQDISIPVKGGKNLTDGLAEFTVFVTEAGGFESNHQDFLIKTRSYVKPELKIINADFRNSEGGDIQLNKPANLDLVIKNIGKGTARKVAAELLLLYENVWFAHSSSHIIKIDEIQPGDIKEIGFQVVAGQNYFLPELPVMLKLTEDASDFFLDTMFMTSIHLPEEEKAIPAYDALPDAEEIAVVEPEEPETDLSSIALPNLEVYSQEFIDQDKNKVINVEESCVIKLKVKNSGNKAGEGVYVHITQLNSNISGLKFPESIELGVIPPKEKREVNIPIRSVGLLPSDVAEFRIEVLESNGLDAIPLVFEVETAELLKPDLAISYSDFLNETGILRRNYPIELKISVKNRGPGNAADLKVKFELPEEEGCVILGEKDIYDLDLLANGETKSFNLLFTATRRYTPDQIPVKVVISESHRKYGIDTLLVGNLNAEAQAVKTHKVKPMIIEPAEDKAVAEPPVARRTTDSRGGGDPLKGLGYEEAVKDMEIGRYFFLIIGIDEYQGVWAPLNNAVRDAIAFEDMIRSKYKFDNIRALHNSMATEENIIRELEWLVRNVTPDDNILIFYSGHGEYKKELNRGYWVPVDATSEFTSDFISNSVIQDYLKAMNSRHTLLISDACFSGDIFRGETISIPFEKTERYYRNVHLKMSRQAITSGGIEPVMDGGRDGHSVFTYYLLKSLGTNQERFFDASQLYNDLKIPVVNNSSQSPDFQHLKNTGDEGGQFIFIHK